MSSIEATTETAKLEVENIGGISSAEVDLERGVNVLSGRNATNRTSLLTAIMAALGSENVSLKGDAEHGEVTLQIGSETYTRRLTRTNGGIAFDGDPYLEDPELADLFAFLLESNEARRAVAQGQDLRELIMRPVDTDAIQQEIDDLVEERRQIDEQLDELSSLSQQLPDLEQRRTEVENEIEEKQAELAEKREAIAEMDADLEDSREDKQELNRKLEALGDARSDLESTRQEIENQRASLESLRSELSELEPELDDVSEAPEAEIDHLESEIDRLRSQKQSLQSEINDLQSIIQFNEDMLEGTSQDVLEALQDGHDDGAITDQLLGDDERIVCWTCGHEVDREDVEGTVDRLGDLRSEKLDAIGDIDDRIDELKDERIEYREQRRQRDQLENSIERAESEIDRRESKIDDLQERRSELEARVQELETEVEELEERDYSETLEVHKEANQLEFELGQLEDERDRISRDIEEIDDRIGQRESLEDRRDEISEELEELRTRIDRIESDAVQEFNDHMETVLGMLDYENLERIWIERTETETREGRRKVQKNTFELHIIRTSESGTAYEDTVDHLSESEREVTGLVFALAGYLVHEVYHEVPFMVVDSLEAIDSNRIAELVEYFEDYPDFLTVALLEEDAAALEGSYQRITSI